MMCPSGAQTGHDVHMYIMHAKLSMMPQARYQHASHQSQLLGDWLI